jgi:Protein of unknown function (DUF4035)
MLAKITGKQLAEWQAYDRLDPFGYERLDLHAGIIASTDANINRGKKGTAYEVSDFMPHFGPRKRKTREQLKAALMAFVAAYQKPKKADGSQ